MVENKNSNPKTYKIEKGIALPSQRHGGSSAFKQLRDYMEIGDSIVVDSLLSFLLKRFFDIQVVPLRILLCVIH